MYRVFNGCRVVAEQQYILHFCPYGDMSIVWMYVIDVSGYSCVLINGTGCFQFWSFHVDTDVIGYMLLVLIALYSYHHA
jgi:hypothetical protein